MPARRFAVRIVLIAAIYLSAAIARAEVPGLEPGMSVVAKSPDFILRNGGKPVALGSPFVIFRVEQVEGDRVRLYTTGREGDASDRGRARRGSGGVFQRSGQAEPAGSA